jgi:single-stranded DNA-binding protein
MSKTFEIEGTLKVISETQSFASGFTKREFVVEVEDGKYPQMIKFEVVKDKTALLDQLSEGDPVSVAFDIRGNEYNGRYYVNLNAWKVERGSGGGSGSGGGGSSRPASNPSSQSAPSSAPAIANDGPPSHMSEAPGGYGDESDDDIPF